jgi:hypothetical protein
MLALRHSIKKERRARLSPPTHIKPIDKKKNFLALATPAGCEELEMLMILARARIRA